jgi:ribose-phosphate pyrophosphokinase
MEVLLLTDALRRAGIKNISLTSKYFPYARQDRVCYVGESLSVKVVSDIINSQNYDNVTIWDAHSDVTPALLNNVKNVPCTDFVRKVVGALQMQGPGTPILVAPDNGAAKKVMSCAKELKLPMLTAEKVRDTNDGTILRTKVDVPSEYATRDFLIVDDICDGGRTFIELNKVLCEHTTGKIYLYITHGIFSAGFDELAKHIDHIYTPNSFIADVPNFVSVI